MSTKKLKNKAQERGQSLQIKKRIVYSEAFKRQKVNQLVAKTLKVSELCEQYGMSRTAVYKWIYQYSPHHKRQSIQVVQMQSEGHKTKLLQSRVAELEAALGRKQLQIDYLDKLIELAGVELDYDLKKNFGAKASNGFETTRRYTDID